MAFTSDRGLSAGGKMPKSRRIPASSRSPYDRPPSKPLVLEEPGNPNWLSNLIYPAKMIASGAGKVLSFLNPDSPSPSSSSVGDSDDNDDEAEAVENDVSSQKDDLSNKVFSSSSKCGNKQAIKQLVMQESFSSEEGNELITLIKSRVENSNGNLDDSAGNMRSTAIMEARKWLQHKKSASKKKMELDFDVTALASPSNVTGIGKGSPVDMAKSYMHNRPAWASTSMKQSEFGSSPLLGVLNFKEETPKSILCSSEMKRNSLSSGSWNILEEIRRVRSKATEELLAATPLTKTVLSPLSSKTRDAEKTVTGSLHDQQQNVLPDVSANCPSGVNKDGVAVQPMELPEYHVIADLKSDRDASLNELRSTAVENGFPSTSYSLTARQDSVQKFGPSGDANGNVAGANPLGIDVHMEDLNPEQGPSADVSVANTTDSVVNGSQKSSSMQLDYLSQELSQSIAEHSSKPKSNDKPKSKPKPKAETKTKPKPKSKLQPQSQPQPKGNAPERGSRGYELRGKGRGK